MALVDLAAILPLYLGPFAAANAVVFQLLRVFRLLRVLKLGRYRTLLGTLGRVELSRGRGVELAMVVILSTLLYTVEQDAQPQVFSSVPVWMWWGIVTLTTAGYGDVYPVTMLGERVAASPEEQSALRQGVTGGVRSGVPPRAAQVMIVCYHL